MATVLVCADDLGYSAARDAGILRCIRAGAVHRVSLMVRGCSAAGALPAAVAAGVPVALHLNLTEGAPASAPVDVPSLVDPSTGSMLGKVGFRAALARGAVALADVAREAAAQVALYRALHPTGDGPRAFDGHQHVHVLPGVAAALAAALAPLGVAATRIPEWAGDAVEPLGHLDATGSGARAAFYRAVSADARAARAVYARAGIDAIASVFVGFGLSGSDCTLERVRATLLAARAAAGSSGCVEWMAHPGFRCFGAGSSDSVARAEAFARDDSLVCGGGAVLDADAVADRAAATAAVAAEGCGGAPPDDFACSWEREREVAVLCAAAAVGLLRAGGSP